LGTALQLCAVRYFGFCPADLHTASSDVITCLASQLQVSNSRRGLKASIHRTLPIVFS
jgi:hypothetical protein